MKKILIAALVGMVAAPAAMAQSASANGDAQAVVVQPIQLAVVPGTVLNFGTLSVDSAAGGTVTVDAVTGAGTTTGQVTLVPGNNPTRQVFSVTGTANAIYVITTGGGTVTTVGGDTMTFTTNPENPTGALGAAGTDAFGVGGVLQVTAAQPAGDYQGTYPVTVSYQ